VIVAIVLVIGPVIRHYFNVRHEGKEGPLWTWLVAGIGMLAIAWLSGTGAGIKMGALPETPKFAAVQDIVMSRCSMCHSTEPVWAGFVTAPKGVLLDSPEQIKLHARMIDINAVRSHAMPPGNITDISPADRQVLAAWIAAGAPVQ
jgi:uncharacterized membrane protein